MSDASGGQDPTEITPDTGLPDLGALDGLEAELDDVARSLERLDDGTYGTCEVCRAPLAESELVLAPAERRCADHRSSGPIEPSG